jgi:hydroxyethylthiazole kinase-like uncharacterized protein yjeF
MRLPTRLSRRKKDAHKGDFGHILVLAGSPRYSGAALLCVDAAMRSGAGLVTLGIPQGLSNAVLEKKLREVMLLPLPETKEGTLSSAAFTKIFDITRKMTVVAMGPGLTQQKNTQNLLRRLIAGIDRPLVIDADALNALAGHLDLLSSREQPAGCTVLTPHPAEMARLIGEPVAALSRRRKETALAFAKKYNVILVLKGSNTVVAEPGGKWYINKTGNPGMATAGSGDVLTGIIAAFLGQGLNGFEASKYAVYLHGVAGDLAAKEKTQIGMIASDIIVKLPEALKRCS